MRRGRAKDKERRETEEPQTTGYRRARATGKWKNGYESKLKNPRKPHRREGMKGGGGRTQQGRRSSAVRQVLKPPAPPSPSQPSPSLNPPTPLPSLAEGESTWAQDGVETRRNTAHTDGGWATDLACSPYGTPVEVSRVHLTKGGNRRKNNSLLNRQNS